MNPFVLAAATLLAQAPTGWYVTGSPAARSLAFGERGADHAQIVMRCRGGQVRIYVRGLYTGDGSEPRRAEIIGGRNFAYYPLWFDPHPGIGGSHRIDVPASAPPLRAFSRTGRIAIEAGNAEVAADATSTAERQAISRFLARC